MCVPSTHPMTCGNPNFFSKLLAACSKLALVDGKTIYFFLKLFIMALTTTRKVIDNVALETPKEFPVCLKSSEPELYEQFMETYNCPINLEGSADSMENLDLSGNKVP